MIRVLIAGEGSNELGPEPPLGTDEGERASGGGVIEALMTKVRLTGWLHPGDDDLEGRAQAEGQYAGRGDARTVAVVALRAREMGCNALVFLRDRDGYPSRQRTIGQAIATLDERRLQVAGGVPVEKLEHWLLALKGQTNAHGDVDPIASLAKRHGVPAKQASAMVQLVWSSRLLDALSDAVSPGRGFGTWHVPSA